jgi:hypothetical protein
MGKQSTRHYAHHLAIAVLLFSLVASSFSVGDEPPPVDLPKLEPGRAGPTCDYIPHNKSMPAVQCGMNDLGVPNLGRYRCGNTIVKGSCQEVCTYVECETDFGKQSTN